MNKTRFKAKIQETRIAFSKRSIHRAVETFSELTRGGLAGQDGKVGTVAYLAYTEMRHAWHMFRQRRAAYWYCKRRKAGRKSQVMSYIYIERQERVETLKY